ncbi:MULTISPECIES: hypothetical protein [Lysinibacillus]|nr:hypothetical protein [Lysinibacillus capsici]MCT1541581.1 hypothetical protein [Lysinibacillus capsici]MCT1572865.1 hypothetical protein [Lysinibacillus capsici]MCT1650029.1 hypothetical protein [Lysinibacillus capsici]MCT1728411.1 hypothetical protein [Lysinibacillus capsici]MCT1786191.1 hypothetical protein [Lysinibacillus capsici]
MRIPAKLTLGDEILWWQCPYKYKRIEDSGDYILEGERVQHDHTRSNPT